jgi:hypothetical protein
LRASEPAGKALFQIESDAAGNPEIICRAGAGGWGLPLYIMVPVAGVYFFRTNCISYYGDG